MALEGNDRAYLTARAGVGRAGAIRAGFTPAHTQGLTPGSAGGFYVWREAAEMTLAEITAYWTVVVEP